MIESRVSRPQRGMDIPAAMIAGMQDQIEANRTLAGQVLEAAAGFTWRAKITSIAGDVLSCTLLHGGAAVEVLRPALLRPSLADRLGVTFTYASHSNRTAVDGATTETQVIVPAYAVDDELTIVQTIDAGGQLGWLDLNTDARAWAEVV